MAGRTGGDSDLDIDKSSPISSVACGGLADREGATLPENREIVLLNKDNAHTSGERVKPNGHHLRTTNRLLVHVGTARRQRIKRRDRVMTGSSGTATNKVAWGPDNIWLVSSVFWLRSREVFDD